MGVDPEAQDSQTVVEVVTPDRGVPIRWLALEHLGAPDVVDDADNTVIQGKAGADLDIDAGRHAARLAALSALATLRDESASLDRVARIVSVRGVVNATPDFYAHTQVVDGASEVFEEVFGAEVDARLAVGVSSLPANLALEIELLAEVR